MGEQEQIVPGLEGVIAAETRLSRVDGQRGELIIGGYPVEELAVKATYEEVAYLLWHGRLYLLPSQGPGSGCPTGPTMRRDRA